jgi:hypothetical protein
MTFVSLQLLDRIKLFDTQDNLKPVVIRFESATLSPSTHEPGNEDSES